MAHLSVNQASGSVKSDCPLPIADTYADAILRTLSSFKPPSPPILQYRRSHSRAKTSSQAVVNEVSGLKTCIHLYVLHFRTFYFQVEVNGRSNKNFFSLLFVRSFVFFFFLLLLSYVIYIQDVIICRLSLKLNISPCVHVRYFSLGMW